MTGWAVPGLVNVRQVAEDAVGRRVIARHRVNRKVVAVTYLSPEFRADAEFRDRFAIDSERLAQVRHASVARVHQYVECGEDAAIVADHVDGTPLRALLGEEGALHTEAAMVVFKDALGGLSAGHTAGLVHGDLKPEYVVVTRAGRVRLVDFGLYTHAGRRSPARSTPFYLAPEQWKGRPASGAADLYAAAAIFFECLVGAPPFHAGSSAALAVLHERGAPPLDAVPAPVRDLVRAGLAKYPAGRPGSRLMLARVEEAAAHGLGPDWERRGRRELAGLLARPVHPGELPAVPVPAGVVGRIRHVRLAAVLGGALVLAAGLSSPPFPSVLLPGPSEISGPDEATPPVMAFPGPSNGTAGVATDGETASPDGPSDPPSAAVAPGSADAQDLSRPAGPVAVPPTSRSIPSQRAQPGARPRQPAQPWGSAPRSEGPVALSERQPNLPDRSGPAEPEHERYQQPGPRVVQAELSGEHSAPRRYGGVPVPRTYSGRDRDRGGDVRGGDVRGGDARGGDVRSGDRGDGEAGGGHRSDCGAADEHRDASAPGERRPPSSPR